MNNSVQEVRVALTVEDFDTSLRLYRDALGLPIEQDWSGPQGRVILLTAGRATIELLDAAQASYVDQVEAGRRVAGPVRLAFGVPQVAEAGERSQALGVRPVHDVVLPPWGGQSMRLETREGVQLTLFELP